MRVRPSSRRLAEESMRSGPELVCLPHAGGGASSFREWPELAASLAVRAACLPGREQRSTEPPSTSMNELVGVLLRDLATEIVGDYALYGHSFGALVAFELTRSAALDSALPTPRALYVAGCADPAHLPERTLYDLPRDQLVEWLVAGGELSSELVNHPEVLDFLLTTVRADLQVFDTYRCAVQEPLPVPIHVFCGERDAQVSPADACGWEEHTSSSFEITVLPGDHFFVKEQAERMLAIISAELLGSEVNES